MTRDIGKMQNDKCVSPYWSDLSGPRIQHFRNNSTFLLILLICPNTTEVLEKLRSYLKEQNKREKTSGANHSSVIGSLSNLAWNRTRVSLIRDVSSRYDVTDLVAVTSRIRGGRIPGVRRRTSSDHAVITHARLQDMTIGNI
ncbi:hypothetical protein CBL_07252 [Carabus blaptoides fortunei]